MLIHYDYMDENRVIQKDHISWIVLRTTSPGLNDKVAKAIDSTFADSADETTTDSEKAFTKAFAAQFGNIALIVGLVVGAAFVTILMIVGNTMAMSIRERTREIGVLKTLGFSGAHILRMVLAESTLLAVIGGAPGLALAGVAIFAVRDQVMQFAPTLTLPPVVVGAAFALMLALGVLTGLFPALSAMRLKIADALGRS
jgi:putative ABC transport system permease protein